MSTRTVLCIDDDGDTMVCTRAKGPCKASVTGIHTQEHFCPGCIHLNYELKNLQPMKGLSSNTNYPMN